MKTWSPRLTVNLGHRGVRLVEKVPRRVILFAPGSDVSHNCTGHRYSFGNLEPAVDRQPGSPRDETRREGSACAPSAPCELFEAPEASGACSDWFLSTFFRLPKNDVGDTMSMRQKIAQKLKSVICIMLVQLRLCSKMPPVSVFEACEPEKTWKKTYKKSCFF